MPRMPRRKVIVCPACNGGGALCSACNGSRYVRLDGPYNWLDFAETDEETIKISTSIMAAR